MVYNNHNILHALEYRKNQLKIRVEEVTALIDEMYQDQGASLLKRLGFPDTLRLDMEKLVLGGHSFGGMTAVKVSEQDTRVKLCATFDPWLYCNHEEIDKGLFKLNIPQIVVSSEKFHESCEKDFGSWETVKNLFKFAKEPRHENIIVKNTDHLHQCDLASVSPLEVSLETMTFPQATMNETYMLMSQLIIDFMTRQGFNTRGGPKAVT